MQQKRSVEMVDFCHDAALRKESGALLSESEAVVLRQSVGSCKRLLEVGHFKGYSTVLLASALRPDGYLVTIDHHLGDQNVEASSPGDCMELVGRYAPEADVVWVHEPFESGLLPTFGPFDFVFYDAEHSIEASERFWKVARDRMSHRCVFAIDDGDWPGGERLVELAVADGFLERGTGDVKRLNGDKQNPLTYTLRVLDRGW